MQALLQWLIDLVMRAGHWSYAVIFAAAALESAAFLGLFVPGEALVLVSGFLSAQGVLDLDVLLLVVALGAALGDSLGYEMGRQLGRPWAQRYGGRFGVTEERLLRVDGFWARHGAKAVFFGRFIGFARALVPFLAGSSGMRYRVFLLYNALGAGLWAIVFVLLGRALGASWYYAEHWIGRASAIVGAAVLLIMALAWLARWSARHELALKERWETLQRRPWVGRVRRRYAPQLAWLRARLSPGSYLGLQLTVGVVAMIGAAWLFGGVAEDVVHRDPLIQVDAYVAQWLQDHSVAGLTTAMLAVSRAHEWLPVLSVTVLLCLYFWRTRQREWLQITLLTVPLGMLLNWGLKLAFRRPRPTVGDYVQALQSYSFPSGHTVAATLLYGLLALYLVSIARNWSQRVAVVAVALACVWLVAFSRIYLGVHYLSDVLAAMAVGLFWVALCSTAIHTLAAARRARP
ncbi:hypothetical protein BH11PSE10_BH11PSE10_16010 [soil metagenome]